MLYDYVSIDLETTGLNAKEDTILEIGAIRVRNGVETAFFHTLIDPKREIPQHITELTGITSSDIKGKPIFREIQNELLNLIDAPKKIGLTLTDSFLLIPQKSVTAVFGITKNEIIKKKQSCNICNLKDNCTFRKGGTHCGF